MTSIIDIRIGANIRRLRNMQRLTLEEVAEKTGIQARALGEREQGLKRTSAMELHLLVAALNATVADVYEDVRILIKAPQAPRRSSSRAP
jgi:transcriptional regulator with XRE-family HTH domain